MKKLVINGIKYTCKDLYKNKSIVIPHGYKIHKKYIHQDRVEVFTDGSCLSNPGGPSGWAAHFIYMGRHIKLKNGCKESTNNRMEMTAVIKALEYLLCKKHISNVIIYTDSNYTKEGYLNWMHRDGWINPQRKNYDLWIRLKELYILTQKSKTVYTLTWVKAHNGHEGNELADKLANEQANSWIGKTLTK